MYFLLSGEGPTDIGSGDAPGPMSVIVDQIVEGKYGYSFLEAECMGFVPKRVLAERGKELKPPRKSPRIPGKKKAKETLYFFQNARALADIAKEKQAALKDDVVAVLFRDADGAASDGRGLWENKRHSMIAGFEIEDFPNGVPMIPKPKSEAWLICALKKNPYHGCKKLEERSGNDDSPNPLKRELAQILDGEVSAGTLCEKVRAKEVDIDKIDMPSLKAFRDRLEEVIG